MNATRRQPSSVAVMAALVVGLVAAMVAGVAFGAVSVPPAEAIAAIGRALRGSGGGLVDALIVQVRLPRVVLAALVGAALAGAGTLYQALFRNPLADPYILGISSGAGLGAIIALTLTVGITAWRFAAVPLAAFVGALLTVAVVVKLASVRGRLEPTSLLLAGVALSYMLAAITSFVSGTRLSLVIGGPK